MYYYILLKLISSVKIPLISNAWKFGDRRQESLITKGTVHEPVKEALTTNLTPKPGGRRRIPEPQRLL